MIDERDWEAMNNKGWEQTTMNPRRAYYDGRKAGQAEMAVILQDLIAELQSEWMVYDDTDGHKSICKKDDGWVKAAADRAEQRLREVQGE